MFLRKRLIVITLIAIGAVGAVMLVASALSRHDPGIFFTDNILSGGPTQELTVMEMDLLERLAGAENSIDVAVYGFNRESVRDALVAAHQRGVTVRVVTDDDAYLEPSYFPAFSSLEAAGIPLVNDSRSSLMHNKFFIIDGEFVWSGSTNLTDNGFTYNHNNALVFTSTVVADIFTLEFEEMFTAGLFGTDKTDNVTHSLTYNGLPLEIYFSPSDAAMSQLLSAVATADNTIHFGIFFYTDDDLRDAMIERLQAGVTIQGVWDALGAGNLYSEDETLCAAGADIKIDDLGGLLHHKFMVIDAHSSDPLVISGSMNWTAAGGQANDENIVIIHDAHVAQHYLLAFEELYAAIEDDTVCAVIDPPETFVFLPLLVQTAPTPIPQPTPSPTPGPTPTATPTPPPTAVDIHLTQIVYNPDGDDVQGEYVQLENRGSTAQSLQNWTLRDEANHIYQFPAFTLAPGAAVRVWTKVGSDTSTELYWGFGSAIWNNTGDTAVLRDAQSLLIDSCAYAGGGVMATCD